MQEKTYCLINYGCQMNESDTEHYAGQLEELGYKPVTRTAMPTREGYYYTEKWTETETAIVQGWEEHEQSSATDYTEVLDIMTGEKA